VRIQQIQVFSATLGPLTVMLRGMRTCRCLYAVHFGRW